MTIASSASTGRPSPPIFTEWLLGRFGAELSEPVTVGD